MSEAARDTGALGGLRVVDLTNDHGRFATKLLAEFGADVLAVSPTSNPGLPLADQPAGVATWWYDHNKRRAPLDLDTDAGRDAYRQLAAHADLIVETEQPGRLAELGVDYEQLAPHNPTLVQVSITPYGRTGPKAHQAATDVTLAASSGVMALTGLSDRPLATWGAQSANYAGFYAAVTAIACHLAARRTGHGTHVDLSIHEAITGSIENLFLQYFFDDVLPYAKIAPRQGALHWLRAYDLAKCADGHVLITPTPTPEILFDWMAETDADAVSAWRDLDPGETLGVIDEVMDAVRRWVAPQQMASLWTEAQRRHVAFGGVLDIDEVCRNPQFAHREFFVEMGFAQAGHAEAGPRPVTMPARLARLTGTAEGRGTVARVAPAGDDTPLDEVLAAWAQHAASSGHPADGTADEAADPPAGRDLPLRGIRVADFTWVLAGPFATRLLGDLGADVIRVQTEERSTIVNSPDFPYYFVWNRSKRSASLDVKHPDGLAAARRLIEQSDVLIENYSAGVFARWGLTPEVVAEWNPRLIYVSMSGCGHDGPWEHIISYAPTVHAVCGITHLTNFADRGDVGPGYSLNDHLAGFAAATATLAALAERERSGKGQYIDLAQLEVGTYCIGPAIVAQTAGEQPPMPAGNADGVFGYAPNDVYRCADGFVAVSVADDHQWHQLVAVVGSDRLVASEFDDVAGRRAHRAVIDEVLSEWCGARVRAEAEATLLAAGVPAAAVADADDLANCAQHAGRGFWADVDHGIFGQRTVDSFPALLDGKRLAAERLSPLYLGEHNFDVWCDVAGYSFDEVAAGIGDGLFR